MQKQNGQKNEEWKLTKPGWLRLCGCGLAGAAGLHFFEARSGPGTCWASTGRWSGRITGRLWGCVGLTALEIIDTEMTQCDDNASVSSCAWRLCLSFCCSGYSPGKKRHKTLVITNITLYMMVTPATCACWHFSVSNSMSVQCHEVKSKRIDEWCLEFCFPIQLVSHVKVRSAPQITRSHKVRRPAKMHTSSRLTKTILQAAPNHRKEFLEPLGEKLGYLCLIVISIPCTVCSKNPLVQISAGKSWSNCLIWGLHLSHRQTERIIAKTSVRRVSGNLSSQAGSTRF